MLHITCSTNGFYVSQSSDSVFNAAASEEHSTVYSTLCHLLVAVSPAFAAWYKQHVEEGDRTEKFSLEEILDSLPTLASNTIPSQHWFASSQDDTVSVELLHQAAQLLAGETLPYLSSDVTPAPNWLQEYNLVKDQVDAELQPFYSYSLENEFAAAAVRGARRIVDGRRGKQTLLGRGAGGGADDGRAEDVPSGRHHVHGHRALARQHGSARPGQLQRAGRREGRA